MSLLKDNLIDEVPKNYDEYDIPKDKNYKVVATLADDRTFHTIYTGYKRAKQGKEHFEKVFIGVKKVEILNI